MDKFEYQEDDLLLGDSQCDLCVYFDKSKNNCKLIGEIPQEILSDDITCEKFEYEE